MRQRVFLDTYTVTFLSGKANLIRYICHKDTVKALISNPPKIQIFGTHFLMQHCIEITENIICNIFNYFSAAMHKNGLYM